MEPRRQLLLILKARTLYKRLKFNTKHQSPLIKHTTYTLNPESPRLHSEQIRWQVQVTSSDPYVCRACRRSSHRKVHLAIRVTDEWVKKILSSPNPIAVTSPRKNRALLSLYATDKPKGSMYPYSSYLGPKGVPI